MLRSLVGSEMCIRDSSTVMHIYPNPSHSLSQLTIASEFKDSFDLSIFNQIGQLIYSKKNVQFKNGKYTINETSEHQSGLYTVNIISNGLNHSEKIIIK